jgi:hypothetical protein
MYKIIIPSSERFGNNIKQLFNAIYLAEKSNTPKIQFDFAHFNATELTIQINENMPVAKEIVAHSFFYDIEKQFPNFQRLTEQDFNRISKYITPLLIYEPPLLDKYDFENGLFIHIRSGDIFSTQNPHPKYAQPPLDYYLKIIHKENASEDQTRLYFFYEDAQNPVVNKLKEIFPNATHTSLSMPKLIGVFLNTRKAVSGQGTLISSILRLNPQIQIHYTISTCAPCSTTKTVKLPNYIKQWKNTKEQHEIMLNYRDTIL